MTSADLGTPVPFGDWNRSDAAVGLGNKVAIFRFDASGQEPVMRLAKVVPIPAGIAPFFQDPSFSSDHTQVIGYSVDKLSSAASFDLETNYDGKYVFVVCEVVSSSCASTPSGVSARGIDLVPLRNPSR
jgi:hypothetical protein